MYQTALKIYYQTTIEVIKGKLQCRNYFVTIEKEIPGGHQIRLSTGSIVNVMKTGKIILQGKNDINIKEILGFLRD
ncbi:MULTISPECIES: hypothetical protein [Sphingobacterium]|uniref:hypothetical protein n=1 Tax=Sphingobacterium TaxID=28453 RepID=UPI0025D70BC2|nr:hypothetical protein [Sphingobacterium sp. UBA6320]